jgi:hypothetical protein
MKKVHAAVIAALLFAGILSARLTGYSQPAASACSTQREMRNVGGLKFEIRRVDCDTLAKDASVSVLVVADGKEKTEIFKYEPDERNPLPVISMTPGHHILISVPSVASIYTKADNWQGTTIEYNIGAIYYK